MPLPLPRLDTRTFDQLVSEGQVLLPRYAPAWTDYNAHDPGITLLELFAWLAEIGFYRLDRTPPASLHTYLRLAGAGEVRAARVAETVVIASLTAPPDATRIAAGTRVESGDGTIRFQTAHSTSICAPRLVAVLTGRSDDFIDRSTENSAGRSPFEAFGLIADPGHALYLGFDDRLVHTAAPISLFVSTGLEEQDRCTRARLQAEWDAVQADALKETLPAGMSAPSDTRLHYGVRVVWEYFVGGGIWAPLDQVEDETRALTLSGLVRFTVPSLPSHALGGVAAASLVNRFFIRCRLEQGRYDCVPRLQSVRFNALRVRHAVDVEVPAPIWISNGRADQTLALPDTSIVSGTTALTVIDGDGAESSWSEAPDWDRIGPHDRTFVVAYDSGTVEFGDGRIGRVPRTGARLRVRYQAGAGPSGNISPGTLTRLIAPPLVDVAIDQPFAALGGEAAEDIDAAIGRALALQAACTRAVTLQDFEDLTLTMPGVPIARAHAIADYDPELPCLQAAGHVTVVVVPLCPAPRPQPTPALLCAVACYLERRRTLTTELHVVGPCFTTVSARARLHPVAGVAARDLVEAAREALNQFFDPLHGGPDRNGWPVGRNVYRAEVMALLNDLPGVSYVDEVMLQIGAAPGSRCGNGSVCRHGLVVSGTHAITIDSGSHCR